MRCARPGSSQGTSTSNPTRFANEGFCDLLGDACIHALPGDAPTCYKAGAEPSLIDCVVASPAACNHIVKLEAVTDVWWKPHIGQKIPIKAELEYNITRVLKMPSAFCRPKRGARKKPNPDSEAQRRKRLQARKQAEKQAGAPQRVPGEGHKEDTSASARWEALSPLGWTSYSLLPDGGLPDDLLRE